MLQYALSFLLGIVGFSLKSNLSLSTLDGGLIALVFLLILGLLKHHKSLAKTVTFLLLGFGWMWGFSTQVLSQKVNESFLNHPIKISGKILTLPENSAKNSKFLFQVHSPFQGKVKLAWYQTDITKIHANDNWQFLVKLKRNNSYQNFAGFDYEKWLFFKQIDATGYVKKSKFNQKISTINTLSIHKIRQKIRHNLQPFLSKLEFGGVINALIIGDRSLITPKHWEIFKNTNTTHLSVISGLHIGLVSGLIFMFFSKLWRKCSYCLRKIPAQVFGSYFGVMAAFIYALMAGFSIPTQRAVSMASVVFLSIIFRRHHSLWQLYALTLLVVLIINPLSVLSIGFWLSFYVIGIIILTIKRLKGRHWLWKLILMQLFITLSTLPLVLWFFTQASIFSMPANLLAIPVFSFITVPSALMGAISSLLPFDIVTNFLFKVANQSLIYLSFFLDYLQNIPINQWHYTFNSATDLMLIIIFLSLFFVKKYLKSRLIIGFSIVTLLIIPDSTLKNNEVKISLLDVGQGLSVVIQSKSHILLFDTGVRFRSGFNLGEAVIVPYLKSKNTNKIDKIILSHDDNDHIGGLDGVLKHLEVDSIIAKSSKKISHKTISCTPQTWKWDGIIFEIFNTGLNFKGNNQACLLKVSNQKFSILLSADIEKKAEQYLVKNFAKKLKSSVLVVPHHGSKTSSSYAFLTTVSPKIAVISSGYKNRFKHPFKAVVQRYQSENIKLLNTACSGQIDILLSTKIQIQEYRKSFGKYYTRQCQTAH
jgi:competence protein ComEC